jgi:hypothetical protein
MKQLVTPRAAGAVGLEAGRPSTSSPEDPGFYAALAAATLPGIAAIAREIARGHMADGERGAGNDPGPPPGEHEAP